MGKGLTVTAVWDDEAQVWVASSEDVYGLNIEADTLEQLSVKVAGALSDLLELNGPKFDGPVPVTIRLPRVTR